MWIFYGGLLTLLLALLAVTAGEKIEEDWKPEGMYRVFLRAAVWLDRRNWNRRRTEQISALLFCAAAGALVALLVTASGKMDRHLTEDGRILRNAYGEGTLQIELEAEAGGLEEILQLEVEERRLTAEELEQMLPEVKRILEEQLKGENESLDQVYRDLVFLTEVEGFPFQIQWESGNYSRVHSDGSIGLEGVSAEGELVLLTATLICGDYSRTEQYWVRVCEPPQEADSLRSRLLNEIAELEEKSKYEESLQLPAEADGEPVAWKERQKDNSILIFLTFLLIGGVQLILPDEESKKQQEERERQLRLAYPEFISKLALLIGAGLPVRGALIRMASDYQEKKRGETCSPVYEELLLTCREMSGGVTEMQAYRMFGERCRLPQYRKCMALLISNQKKGSVGLVGALQEEAENAFMERKHLAREEGERAGTRLLFPMMMTLAVVMVLILVPACFSFAGM